ncbi:unnamed protein product [Cuscuta epithymum]|uniref:K Homology domain-containing protein n=1 Tax=Cuscuta epithymum TaxID=186058 RepID=A0AAV0DTU6_9ASTE|nr:unnamed protein product [Cuscuta epithymum]
MAEEAQYSSEPGPNKRKYEDSASPSLVSRRRTGFSAPLSSTSPADVSASVGPPLYNNVAPPIDDFQLAKQRAQEIAARLLSNSDPTKARGNNNGGSVAFEAREAQKPLGSAFHPSGTGSYGYPGPTKKIEIPNAKVGVIIGRSGETIRNLQVQSGAKIQVTRDMDADPTSETREVELMGTPEQIAMADKLIQDVLSEADLGGSNVTSRRLTGQQIGGEQFVMRVPNNKVGLVIGKGGETIKNMQARSGARIQVIPLHLPPGDTSTERTVQIDGSSDQIEIAKQLVNDAISENRMRNPSMMGAYPQQGYQARPQTSWAPHGEQTQQQPSYGYTQQPGTYPPTGQSSQYSMPQPPSYPGYPPQPTPGGYGPGWDPQSNQNQPTAPGGGYDYYNQVPQQQQTPGGSGGDNSSVYGYNNNQGQPYAQGGYGGYPVPAPQSGGGYAGQTNTIPGYDQQPQGYYGNSSAPPPDSQTTYGAQGDGNQAPPRANQAVGPHGGGYDASQNPSPNAAYPITTHQGVNQIQGSGGGSGGGYGTQPPVPAYSVSANHGQPTTSIKQPPPTTQQPGQPPQVYPTSTGYGAAGYGPPPPYGTPLPNMTHPQYNSSHGLGAGGYSHPSAYPPIVASAVGGTYDTAPVTGSAKTSPQN